MSYNSSLSFYPELEVSQLNTVSSAYFTRDPTESMTGETAATNQTPIIKLVIPLTITTRVNSANIVANFI